MHDIRPNFPCFDVAASATTWVLAIAPLACDSDDSIPQVEHLICMTCSRMYGAGMSGGYLGRSILRSWDCGEDVVLESQEKLYELADAYRRISS